MKGYGCSPVEIVARRDDVKSLVMAGDTNGDLLVWASDDYDAK